MPLVVNASPLILLCKSGYVDLLGQVATACVIPAGVMDEIGAQPDDGIYNMLRTMPWLTEVSVKVPDSIKTWDLGQGESEVIAYALLHDGCRPLLDDAEGKACALAHGLKPMGTGGFLVTAKRQGIIREVAPIMMAIRSKGMWISDEVFAAILRSAGEAA